MMHANEVKRESARVDAAVRQLLNEVRWRFYTDRPVCDFHRDHRMLVYALTWPAGWLEHRALTCSAERYRQLLSERLAVIAQHGDPKRYNAYFPAYLLKCFQDWFGRYGDELYAELKHIRNALDQLLASARFAAAVQRDAQHVEFLAATHRLIRSQRAKPPASDQNQLSLF